MPSKGILRQLDFMLRLQKHHLKLKVALMAKKSIEKTNVMRILDQRGIKYQSYSYADTDAINGLDVANALNQNPGQVFKTLVTAGASKNHYVFLVPVASELNLKNAARAVNEKNIEMLKMKDLFALIGYIHGGCSPIGMKKQFKTVIDDSAQNFETIIFSAGKIGYQVEVRLDDLRKTIDFELKDIKD